MMIAAYVLSFVGFADLINVLYKFSVVGLFIVVAVLIKTLNDDEDHIA